MKKILLILLVFFNSLAFAQEEINIPFTEENAKYWQFNKNNELKGVRLKTKGNGEIYHIFIRTSETRSYSDFYSATFVANSKWEVVDLPFSKFKNRFLNKPLDGNDIRTFGIVAYGRDFTSDVSVSEISFYYQ